MAQSTGIILALGTITFANQSVFNHQPVNWKIPIATGIAATVFAGAETLIGPAIPRGIAMVALVAVAFTRIDPNVPAPAETVSAWLKSG